MIVRSHRISLRRLVAASAATALAVLAVPLVVVDAATPARADGSAQTVTGPNFAWDAVNQAPMTTLPSATVSQTQNLVDQTVHVTWTGMTPSSNNYFDPTPTPGVTFQPVNTLYPVAVYECRGASPAALDSCYLAAGGSTIGSHGLGNSVLTITQADGTGFADLHVETGVDNDLLGCASAHPCSVAVVPAWGGFQPDDVTQPTRCDDHSSDYPTEANGFNGTFAEDGLIGLRCSWANRIVVPLHFAPTPQDCPRSTPKFGASGSPMMQRVMAQWRAGWCRGANALTFDYNSTSNEYQARSSFLSGNGALTASTDVALTSQPAESGDQSKFTYAPLVNTNIAIAFVIDDPATGKVIPNITLNARMMAKLLTQSYAPLNFSCLGGDTPVQSVTCDPAVRGNPQTPLQDPEFLSLNPQLSAADFPFAGQDAIGAFFPTVVNGNSDLTFELSRWIDSDPQAHAFLRGQADQWGMRINTYYKGIEYPTSQFQQLDPGYVDPHGAPGNGTMQNAWQPVTGLQTVGTLLAGNTSNALDQPACDTLGVCHLPRLTEQYGQRDLFAIMDQAQAAAYAFPTAHLVNAAGKAVAPSTESVSAGLAAMRTNPDRITKSSNFGSSDPAAYPLSIVDYALVRTCGMTHARAAAVADLLDKVSQSQTYGTDPGTIAAGYLSLTRTQLAQVAAARQAVAAQSCPSGGGSQVPRGTRGGSGLGGGNHSSNGGGNPNGGSNSPTNAAGGAGGQVDVRSPAGTNKPVPGATPTGPAAAQQAAFGVKRADSSGLLKYALPILLILGGLLLTAGPGAYLAVTTGFAASATRRIGRLLRRRR